MSTDEKDDIDAVLTDELAALDAALLAHDGLDALTSDRTARLAQYRTAQATERRASLQHAERDSDRVGFILATFRKQRGWSVETLADWLGIAPDDYGRLATECRPLCWRLGEAITFEEGPVVTLAERFGAHTERLIEAFKQTAL